MTTIRLQLKPEEDKKTACDQMAERNADHSRWWFTGISAGVLVVWAVLIFIVADWNIMEPWTYLAGTLWIVINSLYFAIFKRKLDSEAIRARRLGKEKKKLYQKYEVNLETIQQLHSKLNEFETRKRALFDIP